MFAVPRLRYETDLSDLEWLLLEPLIPAAKSGGRARRREGSKTQGSSRPRKTQLINGRLPDPQTHVGGT